MSELKKILYVEDEEDIRIVTKVSLETVGGFSVEICSSGEEALEKAGPFQPDLFLLDVMMPGMDGPATLKALRTQDAFLDTPAIFMTARVQPQEIAEYRQMGALDVIAKPFDPMALPDRIREIWAQR